MHWLVSWPYTNCTLFPKGDFVLYHETKERLLFWHPSDKCWQTSNRPTILEDTPWKKLVSPEELEDFCV